MLLLPLWRVAFLVCPVPPCTLWSNTANILEHRVECNTTWQIWHNMVPNSYYYYIHDNHTMSYAVSIEKPQAERPRSPKTTDRSNDIWDNIVVRYRTHDSLTSHPEQKQSSLKLAAWPPRIPEVCPWCNLGPAICLYSLLRHVRSGTELFKMTRAG